MAATSRDPHYAAILNALLTVDLDANEFERCVCEILSPAFPRLVAVPGGQDAGLDGAIADGEGPAFPLVITTAQDAIANLRTNLQSYLDAGGTRRDVVFATSRKLTPRRRQRLQAAANESGFDLIQTYEARTIATLLYRRSDWCRSLLGVDSVAPVLSKFSLRVNRAFEDLPLLGRAADLAWLNRTRGDRVILAPPGYGKTFLLAELAKTRGLFIATQSDDALAAAVRDQKPTLLFLDDAGQDLSRLERVLALRRQVRDFDLVLTAWPSQEGDLRRLLPEAPIRNLEPLRRSDILEILDRLGIHDDFWKRELADQARNRPGFAVLLGRLTRSTNWKAAVNGQGVLAEFRAIVRQLMGPEAAPEALALLGVLSLSGLHGMPLGEAVAILRLRPGQASSIIEELSSAAFLTILPSSGGGPPRFVVETATLRAALVAYTFYSDHRILEYRDAASERLGLQPLAQILLAKRLGAPINAAFLRAELHTRTERFLEERRAFEMELRHRFAGDPELSLDDMRLGATDGRLLDIWASYASLGENEALEALDSFPGSTSEIATTLLNVIPGQTLERLLDAAETEELGREGRSNLGPISAWLQDPIGPIIERRLQLLGVLEARSATTGPSSTVIEACFLAIAPRLVRDDLGSNRSSIRISRGSLLALPEHELRSLIDRSMALVLRAPAFPWRELADVVSDFVYATNDGMAARDRGMALARQILEASRAAVRSPIQLLAWLDLARQAEIAETDLTSVRKGHASDLEEIDALFPEFGNLRRPLDPWVARWAAESPETLILRWQAWLPEAAVYLPRRTSQIGQAIRAIAQHTGYPEPWLAASEALGLSGYFVTALLDLLEGSRREDQLLLLLDRPRDRFRAAFDILHRGASRSLCWRAEEILESSIEELYLAFHHCDSATMERIVLHSWRISSPMGWMIKAVLATRRLPVSSRIQNHARRKILREPIRAELPSAIRQDIWDHVGSEGQLDFAADWLIARLNLAQRPPGEKLSVPDLDKNQRARVLMATRRFTSTHSRLIAQLILMDADLLEGFLQRPDIQANHMQAMDLLFDTLKGPPNAKWSRMALIAVEAGLDPEYLAQAATSPSLQTDSQGYRRWIEDLEGFRESLPGLAHVAELAIGLARELLCQAEREEADRDLHGLVAAENPRRNRSSLP